MTAPKRKTGTDPGPFGSKSAPMHERLPSSELDAQPDAEVNELYRFREIPVSPEMREEFLQAKLPLAKPDQFVDTRPPNQGLTGNSGRGALDRNAPTEPALDKPRPSGESQAGEDSYSRSAPTLLNARRRRGRHRRIVGLGIAALALLLLVWVVARPRGPAAEHTLAATEAAPPAPGQMPGAAAEPEPKSTDLEIEEQPSEPAPDPTSETLGSKNPTSISPAGAAPRPAKPAVSSSPVPTRQTEPSTKPETPAKKKRFDPEELIF